MSNYVKIIRYSKEVGGRKMNKSDFEIRAIVAQVSQKELLDFYTAFRSVTGSSIESPLIDDKYLKENGASTAVAIRALLSAKLPNDSINKIVGLFEEYIK